MNERQYRYVSTLAAELNFTRAAEVLSISQPTLSQFIKKLEQDIGTELFLRNGSELRLTEAGRIFLDYGQRLLSLERSMEGELSDLAEFKKGELKIALSPCRCDTIMPEIVKKFRERYPGITVSICEALAGELLKGIDTDEFTLGVTPLPQNTEDYVCSTVLQEEIILAVPKGSELALRLQRDSADLPDRQYPAVDFSLVKGESFIVMQEWQVMQKRLVSLCEKCGITVIPTVECTNNRTMITMVNHGIGATLLPGSIIGRAERDRFQKTCFYSIKQEILTREIVAIYRKNKKLNEPAKYMLELLIKKEG